MVRAGAGVCAGVLRCVRVLGCVGQAAYRVQALAATLASLQVCVQVCVCVSERERESARD